MKDFIKNYADWILGVIGIILATILLVMLFRGAALIAEGLDNAFGSLGNVSSDATFEVEKAKQLDFRGSIH